MAQKTILFNIDIQTTEYVKKVKDAEIKVADLTNAQQALIDQQQAVGEAAGYSSDEYADLVNQIKAYDAAIKVANKDVSNANKQLEDQVRFTNAAEGSYEQLYRQWKNAEIALKTQAGNMRQLADGTFELTEQGKAAAAQVLKLKEGVLTFNASIKDGRLNVGNYADALEQYTNKLQQASGGNTAFGRAIGGIGDAITQTSAGFELLKEGVTGIQNTVSGATDKLGKLFTVTKGNSFDTLNEGAETAAENIGGIGESGEKSGKLIQVGTNAGSIGFRTLGKAIISTGIGALVVAVGLLINYFLSLQSVTDKLKGVMAGVGAVIDSISKSVFEIAAAIATFDLSRLGDAFGNFFGNAKEAAGAAYDLNEAKIALEETDIKNIALLDEAKDRQEENLLISQDRTRTDKERIDAFNKSIDAEKEGLKIQQKRAKQALDIAQAEVDIANKSGEATREQKQNLAELTVAYEDYEDKLKNAEIRRVSESSRMRNQDKIDRIKANIEILNTQLGYAELSGRETFNLQKKLAKQQLDQQLTDAQLGDEQRAALEEQYRLKVAQINKAADDAEKARLDELEKFKIEKILDGQTREIATIAFATKKKLDAVVKGTKQEADLRKAIAEQGAKEILAVQEKYQQATTEERNSIIASNLKLQQDEINAAANREQQLLELELSRLATKQNLSAEELAYQKNAADKSFEIEERRLQSILNIQLNAQGQRQATDKAYYDALEKQISTSGLTQEEKDKAFAELNKKRREADLAQEQEYGTAVTATVDAITTNRVNRTKSSNQEISDNNKKIILEQLELDAVVIDTITTGLGAISEVLSLNEANQKKYAGILKAISIAELIINLQREISGYWLGVARDTATGGFILGTASSAKATAQTIAASVRAAAGLAKIAATKYAAGGYTVEDAVKQYNPTITSNFRGGYVSSPTMWPGANGMKLAGEAGTEWVSPSWQIKQAPGLFSALESWRRTGVKPFADGGFTSTTITQPLLQTAELVETAIMRGFMAAPAPVVSVQEINDTQSRVSVIESRATL